MKNHTESSKVHVGHQAAKPWGWWTFIKSRQWKNSIPNQNIQPWCHLSPELEQSQVPPVTLRTPHTIWGGKLSTTVLGTHLFRKWIFPRNCSFAEQHRTHQVLGVLLCISSHGSEGPARLMGFLLTALCAQAAHRHHGGSREVYLTMENREYHRRHKVQGGKGRDPYSKEYNLKRV